MPTYEYKCKKCHRQFDVFQKMTDAPLAECSECHGPLKRLIGAGAGFLFKGSGFYITDYRSDSYKQAERRANGDTGSVAAASPSATPSPSPSATPTPTPAPSDAAKSSSAEKKTT